MDFFSGAKELYEAALDKNWATLEKYSSDTGEHMDWMTLFSPLSSHNDNIIHFLVHSGRDELLEKIVDRIHGVDELFLTQVNFYGNTVLHEAAISGNLKAVELLVGKTIELLKMKNNSGETPLFRAAAFGNTKIVKFLAFGQTITTDDGKKQLKEIHRKREDGASVLFAAIQGKHFGTALELLELDEDLTECEVDKLTSIYMLAKLPSLLKSKHEMGMWKKLLYFCLPVGYGRNDDTGNIETKDDGDKITIEAKDDGEKITIENENDIEKGFQSKELSVRGDRHKPKSEDEDRKCGYLRKDLYRIYLSIWKLINQGCPLTKKIWKEKRDHQFAYELARKLIQKDLTWEKSVMRSGERLPDPKMVEEAKQRIPFFAATRKGNAEAVEYLLELYPQALEPINYHRKPSEIEGKEEKRQKISLFAATKEGNAESEKFLLELYRDAPDQINNTSEVDEEETRTPLFAATRTGNLEFIKFLLELYPAALEQISHRKSLEAEMELEEEWEDEEEWATPLLAAVRTGNVEFVKLVIKEFPQALEHTNHRNQNILHVAAAHRQKEIFNLVKGKEILKIRLARQIDVAGYTILHSVADTKHCTEATRSGPAYKLKEELEWFKRVEKIMPANYMMLPAKNKKTAIEIFKKKHKYLLKEAQQWMKDTSQSCSAVAVLVATVVFAAAFTVPGGFNGVNGQPILLESPFFLFFTVMDVISLSCSLTAVVMFLSILTSPFQLEDFHVSLPRRLSLGFALLFMSVATTMLAFASTVFLVIRLDDRRHWTTTLICSAAFFPVSVLALTHFPLFVSFINAWMSLFKFIWNALPCNYVIRFMKSRFQRSIRCFQNKVPRGKEET